MFSKVSFGNIWQNGQLLQVYNFTDNRESCVCSKFTKTGEEETPFSYTREEVILWSPISLWKRHLCILTFFFNDTKEMNLKKLSVFNKGDLIYLSTLSDRWRISEQYRTQSTFPFSLYRSFVLTLLLMEPEGYYIPFISHALKKDTTPPCAKLFDLFVPFYLISEIIWGFQILQLWWRGFKRR